VFALGVANGAFSIAAIGSMMSLAGGGGATAAGQQQAAREGTRMGLWGAAQAIGFAAGGLFGAAASDVARWLIGSPGAAYASVFFIEAGLFIAAAMLAAKVSGTDTVVSAASAPPTNAARAAVPGLQAGGTS
jgi:BCD family chlorophyll transporter-like MFS transporter